MASGYHTRDRSGPQVAAGLCIRCQFPLSIPPIPPIPTMTDSEDIAQAGPKIRFEETSVDAVDFLHELSDPGLLRSREMPESAKLELRRHQVARLRGTISVLVAKREEFNRRMDDYIANLSRLVESLELGLAGTDEPVESDPELARTRVRCLHCEGERYFDELNVVFARESEDSLSEPTELYVLDHGALKKGHFRCTKCGCGSLVIQASS